MKKILFVLASIAMLVACTPEESNHTGAEEGKDGTIHVTGVSLDHSSATIKEGETITLVATVTPENATNNTVQWSSSSDAVATVDANGKVTGVKAGSATITATAEDGGMKATCALSVEANLAPSVTVEASHVSAISAVLAGKANLGSTVSADLQIGFQYSKSAGILPSNSTTIEVADADASYNYTSSITGLEPDTKYYFRSFVRQNGQDTYGETKEFTTKELSSLLHTQEASSISAVSAELNAKLDLTDVKFRAKSSGFYWGMSSESVSTKVTAQEGEGSISADLSQLVPSKEYFFQAYVILDGKELKEEVLSFTTKEIESVLGTLDATNIEATSASLNAKLDLTDVKYSSNSYGFYWGTSERSQNTFINGEAKDNAMTASVTALNHKTQYWYKAYVKLDNQTFYGEVKTFTTDVVKVESVSLDKTEYTFNTIGNTLTLKASVLPADATDKSVEWSSDNKSVATVDNNGRVTAKDNGKAVITVKTKDQEKTATCAVTVSVHVSSISLNKTSLTLNEGEEETLVLTINPSNAADKTIKWTSSDTSVATVDADGKVTAVSKGTTTIKAEANDGSGKYATCSVYVYRVEPLVAVDLGLSIKWANENIGARWPGEYGDYYAWGEIEPYYSSQDPLTWKGGKSNGYYWSTYKWCNGNSNKLTKYCPTDKTYYWDGEGSPDGKTVLEPEDDAAHVKLGGKWRMPTDAEWTELREKCTWTWTTQKGVNGRLVTGPNGNSIFLPAAGLRYGTNLYGAGSDGCYWSSSLWTDGPGEALRVYFNSSEVGRNYQNHHYRCRGESIRPVME